ncbi:substrate-binding periplasmic protein [Albidovulum sp.]|uniref:substrate-binding periplasmic protein n=1 Tax=Albidovulum sp. TaxID=1872424 RepID=UPI0039B8E110
MTSRISRLLASIALSGAALLGMAANASAQDCTPASQFKTIEAGTLKVVAPDFPPFFTYKGDELGGFEGEFFKRFAKDNCLTIEVTLLPAGSVIEAIRNGQGDVGGGGWTPNEKRGEIVGQTRSLLTNPSVFIGFDPKAELEAYAGKTIGTVIGYDFVNDLQAWGEANGATIKLYDSPDAGFADVRAKRLDILVLGGINGQYRVSQFPAPGLASIAAEKVDAVPRFGQEGATNIVHTKDNPELTAALNAEIEVIRADGTLKEMLAKNELSDDLIPQE